MSKINPFNPNSVVTPTLFAGRTKQVIQIVGKLEQVKLGMSANFILMGERGIGKTALAKLIMYLAQLKDPNFSNLNFLATYYTVEKGQHFRSVLQSALNQLTDKLPSSTIARLGERVGNFFQSGKFSFGAFGAAVGFEGHQVSLSHQDDREQFLKDQAVSVLTNILTGLREAKDSIQYDGLLIVLDEVHNTADLEGVAQILRSISTTLDLNGLGNISFLIIGYNEAISRFFEGDPSAKRSFDTIPLGMMPNPEAIELITKGLGKIGVSYEAADLDENVKSAGGYPHCLQILGHNLIDTDLDNHVDKEDWRKAIHNAALELQSKDFSQLYNFNGKHTLREEVVNVLAVVGVPISKTRLAQSFSKKARTSIQNHAYPNSKNRVL